MDFEQLEIKEVEQLEELFDNNSLKLNKLKHSYFKTFSNKPDSYIDFLKIGSRHFTFQLPESIDEIFLLKENSPLFWILESPLLITSERLLSENLNGNKYSDRSEIKKNFTKWVITSESNQKKIFASIVLKLINSGGNTNSFLELIYQSLILILDETFYNPLKAIESLNKAKSAVNEMVQDLNLEKELVYLIQLYKGYALLALGENEEASRELSFSIDHKANGITAKFYFTYLSAIQNREDFTKALIKEIIDYDISRLKYSVDNSSFVLFNFFLNNPVFPNIFQYYEFGIFSDYIKEELIERNLDHKKIITGLFNRLNTLKKYELNEYYTEETVYTIKFLYEINEQYSESVSVFVNLISSYINEKFHFILNEIEGKIKEQLFEYYNRIMENYRKAIEESEKLTEQYYKEVDEIKAGLQNKLTSSIKQIEEYVKDEMWQAEELKKNLNYQSKFDPVVSFRNSMSYNVIVSIIVFLIGGAAGYFNNSDYFESDFYVMLGSIILTGVKWSSLTFVIGFFISVFISGLVLFDRSNEKQRLEKRSLELQKQKELSIDMLRKEAEQKQKAVSEGYLERIEAHKRKIEDQKRDRDRQEPKLFAEAEAKLAPFKEKLSVLYLK